MESRESYTGATQRLYLEPAEAPAEYAAPLAARPGRESLATWAAFALLIVVLLLVLARMPEPAPAPAMAPVDQHTEVFSRNCIGYCP